MSDICSLLQSVSKLCSLCPTFCSLLQSISNLCSLSDILQLMSDFLKAFVVGQLTKQSVSYICILSVIFHSVNDPLGQVTSFLVKFPTIHSFLNVLKSCYLVLFSERKLQKKKTKKKPAVRKTFCLISPQGEHFRT